MQKKKRLNKIIAAVVLSFMMAFGINIIPTKASTITSNVYNTGGAAGYTIYIRKFENGQALGTMYLHKNSSYVYNEFTAISVCDTVVVHVSNTNSDYVSATGSNLKRDNYVIARKTVSNATDTYGYCTVSYDNK